MRSFLSTGLAGFLTSCIIIGRCQTIGRDVYSTDRGSPTGIPVAMDHDDNTPAFRTDRSGCSVSAGLRVFLLPPDSDVCLGHTRSSRRWPQQKMAPPIAHKQKHHGPIPTQQENPTASSRPPKMQLADVWKSCRVATGRSALCRTKRIPKVTETPKLPPVGIPSTWARCDSS